MLVQEEMAEGVQAYTALAQQANFMQPLPALPTCCQGGISGQERVLAFF